MAVTISGVGCAEGYTDVAILGSQLGDPVLKDIGCIPMGFFGDLDGEAACNVFYEPPIDPGVGGSTPNKNLGDYSAETGNNSVVPIIWNNAFQKLQKLPADVVDGVPYDIANVRLEALGKANAQANGIIQLACLFSEGKRMSYDTPVTKDNVIQRIYDASAAIRNTGANPTIAIVSPEFYSAMKMALPNAISSDELNSRMLSGVVGVYDGIRFIQSSLINKGTVAYNNSTNALFTSLMKGIDIIMWDGSKFAAINKIFEAAIKDGGASFPGVGACYAAKLGVKLLESGAAVAAGTGNTSINVTGGSSSTYYVDAIYSTDSTTQVYESADVSGDMTYNLLLSGGFETVNVRVVQVGASAPKLTVNGSQQALSETSSGSKIFVTSNGIRLTSGTNTLKLVLSNA